MSAATFVLAISLFVAFTFATAFGVASFYARSATSARWLAAGYGLGMLNPLLEILVPTQTDARVMEVAVALSLQYAAALGVIGLARHYRLSPPWRTMIAFAFGVLVSNILIRPAARFCPAACALPAALFYRSSAGRDHHPALSASPGAG
nr:hypothetical protein [uncultured Devosia sp.]